VWPDGEVLDDGKVGRVSAARATEEWPGEPIDWPRELPAPSAPSGSDGGTFNLVAPGKLAARHYRQRGSQRAQLGAQRVLGDLGRADHEGPAAGVGRNVG
jgi:hypothetical protein